MNATLPKSAQKSVAVFCDGPQSDVDREGDEIPIWFVYIGDEDAEPVGTVYRFHNCQAAKRLAGKMSIDRRLELVDEAMEA